VANEIRRLVGAAHAGRRRAAPVAVIDATGDPAVLAELTAAVCERGVVVLAGEYLGRVPFDLYPDLHLRGLTAVGIP
jgi:threonine dehydrogenase-like Zn-dependent dehydrogenase